MDHVIEPQVKTGHRVALRAYGSLPVLHAAFVLCGIATALSGIILPHLAAHWGLNFSGAGELLAAQFAGAALGGALTRGRYQNRLFQGLALLALSALATLFITGSRFAVDTVFLAFGIGVGLTTTATSLLVSERSRSPMGSALTLLNAFWSIGAALCSFVAWRLIAAQIAPRGLLALLALLCLLLLAALRLTRGAPPRVVIAPAVTQQKAGLPLVIFFGAVLFFYVGVESSIGGWISTYAFRTMSLDISHSTALASFFWTALLAGRLASPLLLSRISERVLHLSAMALGAIGCAVLLTAHSAALVAAGATISGFAFAPIFPITVSLFLRRARESSRAGIIMGLSGMGGSALPWLTGIVSSRTGSLRIGLLVPTVTLAAMLLADVAAFGGTRPLFVPGNGPAEER